MKIFIDFTRSKSGALLLLFLFLSAAISAAVATYFYNVSLKTFVAQKTEEKATALELVSAFVTTYSSVRPQLGQNAPVPATFRAHSIENFNKKLGSDSPFKLRWVGRTGIGHFDPSFPPTERARSRRVACEYSERPIYRSVEQHGPRSVYV